MDSNMKSYVKNFPEPMATLVCHYKLAREYLEDELGGVIGRDSSRDYFESLEISLILYSTTVQNLLSTVKEMSAPEN